MVSLEDTVARNFRPELVIPLAALTVVGLALGRSALFGPASVAEVPPVAMSPLPPQPVVGAQPAPAVDPIASQAAKVDLVFALDTTGSMSGLIEGAKEKIWSVVDQLASGNPRPEIRIGLVAYRDRGDAYVTKVVPLTEDLDAVYAQLIALEAGGGGDGPESVNAALAEAVGSMQWASDGPVYRAVFLVGDAPAHMDYEDDVPWTRTVEVAKAKKITIHTVLCGGDTEAGAQFAQIASAGGGAGMMVAQSGGMAALETPMDAELARLNRALAATAVTWGSGEEQSEMRQKLETARGSSSTRSAARTSYLSKSGGSVVSGKKKDLVEAVGSGDVEIGLLGRNELPPEMQGLSEAERSAMLAAKAGERARLQAQVDEVVTKRDAWLAAENKRRASEGDADGFDDKLRSSVKGELEALGYVDYAD